MATKYDVSVLDKIQCVHFSDGCRDIPFWGQQPMAAAAVALSVCTMDGVADGAGTTMRTEILDEGTHLTNKLADRQPDVQEGV
jgi:hypothetical protein